MLDLLITISIIFFIFLIRFFLVRSIEGFNIFLQFVHVNTMFILIGITEIYLLIYPEEYYPIRKTKFLPIKNIKGIYDSNNDLTDLDFRKTDGIFSFVKNEEYSKECLHNYYIKQSSECPITDIILEKKKASHESYFEQIISDNMYLYYTRESKLDGKLYEDISIYPVDSANCDINEFWIDKKCSKIIFESNFNHKNVSLIIESEEEKKSNLFKNYIKNTNYFNKIFVLLIILSGYFSNYSPKENREINLYRVISWFFYLCNLILSSIRYHYYWKIKQNLDISKDIDETKKYLLYFAFKLDIIIFSISIFFFIFLIMYLIIPDKCHYYCCYDELCEDFKVHKIFNLFLTMTIIYQIIIVYEVLNDLFYIRENYEFINSNWKQNSITSISINNSKSNGLSLKNFIIELKTNNYSYYDIYTNNNGNSKICGKDSQDNDLYFPKDVECPVNDIFISKFDLKEYNDYTKLKLNDKIGYLYYTNKKTTGKIITNITSDANSSIEIYNNKETGENSKTLGREFNDIFNYEELGSWCENEDSCSEKNISKLFAINYLGVNNSLISKIKDFRKNLDNYDNLCKFKYISTFLNLLDFVYFSCIFVIKDISLCSLGIGIIFLVPMIFYIYINTKCLIVNLKYIQHFLNKINIDFEINKCDSIWTFLLVILGIIYFFYYINIIIYKLIIMNDNCLKTTTDESELPALNNTLVISYSPVESRENLKERKKKIEEKKKIKEERIIIEEERIKFKEEKKIIEEKKKKIEEDEKIIEEKKKKIEEDEKKMEEKKKKIEEDEKKMEEKRIIIEEDEKKMEEKRIIIEEEEIKFEEEKIKIGDEKKKNEEEKKEIEEERRKVDQEKKEIQRKKNEEKSLCIYCIKNDVKIALIPCGHLCCCRPCFKKIKSKGEKTCKICLKEFTNGIEVYYI